MRTSIFWTGHITLGISRRRFLELERLQSKAFQIAATRPEDQINVQPAGWTSGKDTARRGTASVCLHVSRALWSPLLPLQCLGPLLIQVVGLSFQEEWNSHNTVASPFEFLVAGNSQIRLSAIQSNLYT